MSKKKQFIDLAFKPNANISSLCRQFGISRNTAYKVIKCFKQEGEQGLHAKTCKPYYTPSKTSHHIEELIFSARSEHPKWGGEKIRKYLINKGHESMPSEKTIDRILKRNGLITAEESEKHKPWIRFVHENPNDLWQMDFKGHFATLDERCHPLTILDDHSRYSITIHACSNERSETVKNQLINVFREYGLPKRITMDNGTPWGYSRDQQHTTLTAWLIQLGIYVNHSRPNHPQTQGKLERFHRTLKLELISCYQFKNLIEAQEGFDWWREIYNKVRPHAALDHKVPEDFYKISERQYPEKLPSFEYDDSFIVRKVQNGGIIFWKGKEYRVGAAFYGHEIGFKEGENGLMDVYFYHQKVNRFDPLYPNG